MTTYNEPTITVEDWRGREETVSMAAYQERWESAKLREVTRLAMWQGEADDVVAMERLEREFAELRERIVRREFNRQYEKERGHHILDSPYFDQIFDEWSKEG
jgi:hypothetical protein